MKNILFFILLLLIFPACNNTKTTNLENPNEVIVMRYFDAFNKHDWQKMAGMYVGTAEFKDPSLGDGIVKQTHAQIIEKYSELSKIFPDVKDEIKQMYPSGEKHIIVEFESKGTASDGSKFELPICTIFTIEKGKITQDFTYYDNFESK